MNLTIINSFSTLEFGIYLSPSLSPVLSLTPFFSTHETALAYDLPEENIDLGPIEDHLKVSILSSETMSVLGSPKDQSFIGIFHSYRFGFFCTIFGSASSSIRNSQQILDSSNTMGFHTWQIFHSTPSY